MYARFVNNVIDFRNKIAFDVVKLYKIVNVTAKVVKANHVCVIEFARDLHAADVCRARKLATLSLNLRKRFSFAKQQLILSNALVKILHLLQIESPAWTEFVQ